MPVSIWLNYRYREQARSHIDLCVLTVFASDTKPVGASLLAMTPVHPSITVN
jgi:hypothetical protein